MPCKDKFGGRNLYFDLRKMQRNYHNEELCAAGVLALSVSSYTFVNLLLVSSYLLL